MKYSQDQFLFQLLFQKHVINLYLVIFFIVISTGSPLSETYSHVEEQEETLPAEVVPVPPRSHTPELFSDYSDGEKPHMYNYARLQSYIEQLNPYASSYVLLQKKRSKKKITIMYLLPRRPN